MDIIDTQFKLSYDFLDTSAKLDVTYTTSNNESFADLSLFQNADPVDYPKYMTFEHNFSHLDGSMAEFVKFPDIPFYNTAMSDENGDFETPQVLHCSFTRNHSSSGLSFVFAEDQPVTLKITWYDRTHVIIAGNEFTINKKEVEVAYPVENYMYIDIQFLKTLPQRNVKLLMIEYGNRYHFTEEDIIDASLVLEMDPISSKLPIDTLKFSIWDKDNKFNLGNGKGLHYYIQYSQELMPVEEVRGEDVYLGKYYINTYSSTENKVEFNCTSFLGLLDNITYYKGDVYTNGITALALFNSIIGDMDVDIFSVPTFELADDLKNVVLYGALKPQSFRSVLKELCFALSACIYHTYDPETKVETYHIKRKNNLSQGIIERQTKISTKATKKEYVNKVTVKYNTYTQKSSTSEITKGTYPAGDTLITFNSPYTSVTASAGTIIERGKFYCILRLAAETYVTLSGIGFESKTENASAQLGTQDEAIGNLDSEKSFIAQLANYDLSLQIANNILSYYKYYIKLDIKHLYNNEKIQDTYTVQNPQPGYDAFVGNFEKINLDLVNGYVATSSLSCVYNKPGKYYYASAANKELLPVDNFII